MCLVVCVAMTSLLSGSSNYVSAVSHSSSSRSWSSHTWSSSRTWSSHTWSRTGVTTVYTGYNGGGYYNGGYYYGGYYPYQNYCNPYYPSYNCNASYPTYPSYQVPTATTTFTQQNYVTEMVISTASVMIPTTFTSTLIVPTTDNSSVTFYGILVAVLLVLLGASVFLLFLSKSKTGKPPQIYSGGGHYCRNCGNYLNQPDHFCVKCGTQQTP